MSKATYRSSPVRSRISKVLSAIGLLLGHIATRVKGERASASPISCRERRIFQIDAHWQNRPTSDVMIEMMAKVLAHSCGSRICAPAACKWSVFLHQEAPPYLEREARRRSRPIVGAAIHLA
jgi:hypothetical protein